MKLKTVAATAAAVLAWAAVLAYGAADAYVGAGDYGWQWTADERWTRLVASLNAEVLRLELRNAEIETLNEHRKVSAIRWGRQFRDAWQRCVAREGFQGGVDREGRHYMEDRIRRLEADKRWLLEDNRRLEAENQRLLAER